MTEPSGAVSFPVDLGSGRNVDDATVAAFYQHTEKDVAGGGFPLGGNTTWHGGLHLFGSKGADIHACAAGTVVAARLADTEDLGAGYFGSRNFVLVRHDEDARPWYSLPAYDCC